MAKYVLLCGGLVLLKTSTHCGMPIFLKVNHQLESRIQEIWQSGSEGGAKPTLSLPLSFYPSLMLTRIGGRETEKQQLKLSWKIIKSCLQHNLTVFFIFVKITTLLYSVIFL